MRLFQYPLAIAIFAFLIPLFGATKGLAATDPYIPAYDSCGQETVATDFYADIARHDLATVFLTRPGEYLGFIGNDGQRFYIYFAEALKTDDDPHTYIVAGKTRVKNNICDFDGRITIRKAGIYKKDPANDDFPKFRQGFIGADVSLFEVDVQKGSGKIQGVVQSYIAIDQQGTLTYDALTEGADGFENNQFAGTWTSYKTGATKVCNFGHSRFPHTGLPKGVRLDKGVGQFLPEDTYIKNGWLSYAECLGSYQVPGDKRAPEEVQDAACRKEKERWWAR
ncbi:hypothetical protein LJB81_00035 [Desulfovibrio sp. OttesenSCG-928-M14]|nr:hypothetical protein [Desulfovibrio sp. OttesenSCG-928-M14]